MGLDSSVGFFTHMSNAWCQVGHLSLWRVETFPWYHYTWLLQHDSPRVVGCLTCGSGVQKQMQSDVAFCHLALESHKCHFCSTRMVEVVRVLSDSSRIDADVALNGRVSKNLWHVWKPPQRTDCNSFIHSTIQHLSTDTRSKSKELIIIMHVPACLWGVHDSW